MPNRSYPKANNKPLLPDTASMPPSQQRQQHKHTSKLLGKCPNQHPDQRPRPHNQTSPDRAYPCSYPALSASW